MTIVTIVFFFFHLFKVTDLFSAPVALSSLSVSILDTMRRLQLLFGSNLGGEVALLYLVGSNGRQRQRVCTGYENLTSAHAGGGKKNKKNKKRDRGLCVQI